MRPPPSSAQTPRGCPCEANISSADAAVCFRCARRAHVVMCDMRTLNNAPGTSRLVGGWCRECLCICGCCSCAAGTRRVFTWRAADAYVSGLCTRVRLCGRLVVYFEDDLAATRRRRRRRQRRRRWRLRRRHMFARIKHRRWWRRRWNGADKARQEVVV